MDNQHRLIAGYREFSETEIALMNEIKAKADEVGAYLDKLGATNGIDLRWVAIARTDLQQGFMALTRAVTRPTGF